MGYHKLLDLQQIRECDGVTTPERARVALLLLQLVRRQALSNRSPRGAIAAAAGIAAVMASVIGAAGAADGVCQANCQDKIDMTNGQRDSCLLENEELLLQKADYKAAADCHKFDAVQLRLKLDECEASIPRRVAEADLECERKQAEDEYVCLSCGAEYYDSSNDTCDPILVDGGRYRRRDGEGEDGEEKSFLVRFYEGLVWCPVAETARVRGGEDFPGADRHARGQDRGRDGCHRSR